jgi:hypothetical protein
MRRNPKRRWLLLTLSLFCVAVAGCRSTRTTRPYREPPPPDIRATVIDYVETDAFDEFFESALTNQDPVIVIQTGATQPDWGARLNAWLAAWNRGGKVVDEPGRRVRLQSPLSPVTVNGETLREFRLLIDDLMKRVEDAARRGSSWWAVERIQRRRIALLKPYSLRFHLDEDKKIQLIFFNGMYSRYYREFMDSMSMSDPDEPAEWTRAVQCSHCTGEVKGKTMQRMRARSD